MASDKKGNRGNRIPVKFLDSEPELSSADDFDSESGPLSPSSYEDVDVELLDVDSDPAESFGGQDSESGDLSRQPDLPESGGTTLPSGSLVDESAGPVLAELIATRAELKRIQGEVSELVDKLARRQADFENYRKRMERERGETYNKVVAELAGKLLPVLDNLGRALDTEASVKTFESD